MRRQTHQEATGIARIGQRYGLRSAVQDAPSLHAKLRPETPYVSRPGSRTFHTGPWPFGAQRLNLLRTFKSIGWDAIAAQPLPGPHRTGIWWSVTAVADPPAKVLATSKGEVLVVEQPLRSFVAAAAPPVVATKTAMKRFVAKLTCADRGSGCIADPGPVETVP